MDKLVDLIGIESKSIWIKLLIFATTLSVADLHSQLNNENIFSENSLEYVSKNFFSLVVTFAILGTAIVSISGITMFLVLVISNWVATLVLLIVSVLGTSRIYRSKYGMQELRDTAKRISYEGKLNQFSISEEELNNQKKPASILLFFLFAFSLLEISKFVLIGDNAKLIFLSFYQSFEVPPLYSWEFTDMQILVLDILSMIIAGTLISKILSDLLANTVANLKHYSNFIFLFEADDRAFERDEIKRIEAAIERRPESAWSRHRASR